MKKLLLFLAVLFSAIYGDSQWMQANGPGGASIAFFAKSASAIFAITDRIGVFRSTDNGDNWSSINITGSYNDIVNTIVLSKSTLFATDGGRIFRSTDDGITWVKTCDAIGENMSIWALKANKDFLFALCPDKGVFRSSDNGVSWVAVNNGLEDAHLIYSIATVGDIIFAGGSKIVNNGGNHAVFRSLDNGATWSPSDSGIPDSTGIYRFTVSGFGIIAATNRGLYISSNSGRDWKGFKTDFVGTDTSMMKSFFLDNIIMSAEGDTLIAKFIDYQTTKLFISIDKGTTWSTMGLSFPIKVINDCLVYKNSIFLATTFTGIYRSVDIGKNWKPVNSGINGVQISSLLGKGKYLFSCSDGAGVFASVDNGANWTEFNQNLTTLETSSIVLKDDFIYACCPGDGIFRSSVTEANWIKVNSNLPTKYIWNLGTHSGNLFMSSDKGLYVSKDNGENWMLVDGDSVGTNAGLKFAECDSTLFVSSVRGLFYYNQGSNVLNKIRSVPVGETISSIAGEGNVIFVGTYENGCYVSIDKGQNWQKTSLPYMNKPNSEREYEKVQVSSISICGKFAVASLPGPDISSPIGGSYLTIDSGKSWTPIGPDTSWHTTITNLLIRGDTLLAGSFNKGIWKRTLPKVSETAISSSKSGLNPNLQLSLQLSRRASSGLCVTYTLPQPADVSVSIHTLNGSRVASIVNKTQPAGLYNYTCSYGKTSGLYIVRLKTGGQIVSRTIMFTP